MSQVLLLSVRNLCLKIILQHSVLPTGRIIIIAVITTLLAVLLIWNQPVHLLEHLADPMNRAGGLADLFVLRYDVPERRCQIVHVEMVGCDERAELRIC